jgi:hypothetical protein
MAWLHFTADKKDVELWEKLLVMAEAGTINFQFQELFAAFGEAAADSLEKLIEQYEDIFLIDAWNLDGNNIEMLLISEDPDLHVDLIELLELCRVSDVYIDHEN